LAVTPDLVKISLDLMGEASSSRRYLEGCCQEEKSSINHAFEDNDLLITPVRQV
jgi:hypothetical protein